MERCEKTDETTVMIKVFGGGVIEKGRTQRCIVAATSQRQAVKHLTDAGYSITLHSFRQYWTEAFNEIEVPLALGHPGIVFVSTDMFSKKYKKVTHK